MNPLNNVVLFVLCFAVAWASAKIAIPLLKKAKVQDIPNLRSSHATPTPRGGGIGILVAVLIGLIAARTAGFQVPGWPLMVGALFVASVGYLDDTTGKVSILLRLAIHCLAGTIVILSYGGFKTVPLPSPFDIPLGPVGFVAALMWILLVTNVYNFMDGIDGYASVHGMIGGLALVFSFPQGAAGICAVAIAGSCAGFLLHNWHPAKVFMGDVGSTTLGFLFAALPFELEHAENAAFLVFIALWFFLSDGIFTIIRRVMKRRLIWEAHCEHLYQVLVKSGLRHDQVVLKVGVAAAFLASLGMASMASGSVRGQWAVVFVAFLSFILYCLYTWSRALKAGLSF